MTGPRDPHGPHDGPEWERLPGDERVPDADWDALVTGISDQSGFVPEMSPEEIREQLAEDEDWVPPEPERIGWRSAPPLFVLAIVGLIGGITGLVVLAIFFRPVPGFAVLALLGISMVSGLLLFLNLPEEHREGRGGGAEV
ncbi:hypothetical protein [Brevibacterium ihuae]|uniref:hypothetical protein n=1 Tax=Brevibacterium ihuae TaxID=1631743 RepID=UPI000C766DE0|nr:hypothetical protein [Brevibacterium ihuae]